MPDIQNNNFDKAASTYDKEFTHSQIGKAQRRQVYKHLEKIIEDRHLEILELNCGTGEDARYFAKNGHKLLATDLSKEMITIAAKKLSSYPNAQTAILNIKELSSISTRTKYDLIFSNFGGLNCLSNDELKKTSLQIGSLLKKKGKFIAVIMPDLCLWDMLYLTLTRQFSEVFRRTKRQNVNVNGSLISTWYHSPKSFINAIDLTTIKVQPIGLLIPPSFLESWFIRHPFLFNCLIFLENRIAQFSWQSRFSDHYYIEFIKQ